MLDMQTSPRDGASRIGQAEHDDSLLARNSRIETGGSIVVRVHRQTNGDDRYDTFNVPYRKWMRVLDALNWIAENTAADLAFRFATTAAPPTTSRTPVAYARSCRPATQPGIGSSPATTSP